jgi:hypothetical protein
MLTLKYIAYAYIWITLYHIFALADDPDFLKAKQDKFPLDLVHPVVRGIVFFMLLMITAMTWPLGVYYTSKEWLRRYRANKLLKKLLEKDGYQLNHAKWPLYQCHKQVRAIKIGSIHPLDNPDTTGQSAAASYGAFIIPENGDFIAVIADANYMTKHNPQVGGYYVLYDDGYASYSPAKAFEEGYTRIDPIGSHERSGQKAQQDEKNSHLSQVAAAIANVKSAEQP